MRGVCPVGSMYGRLTVLSKADSVNGKVRWLCRCSCGNVKTYIPANLKRGLTKSCGCLQKELQSERQTIDRAGIQYGRLKVISKMGSLVIKWRGCVSARVEIRQLFLLTNLAAVLPKVVGVFNDSGPLKLKAPMD